MSDGITQPPLGRKLLVLAATAVLGFFANFALKLSWQRYEDWTAQRVVRWSRACNVGSCLFTLEMDGEGTIPQVTVQVHQASPAVNISADAIGYGRSAVMLPQVTRNDYLGQEGAIRGFTVVNFTESQEIRYRVQYMSYSSQPPNPPLLLTIESTDPHVAAKRSGQFSFPGWVIPSALVLLIASLAASIYFAVRYHHECLSLRGKL